MYRSFPLIDIFGGLRRSPKGEVRQRLEKLLQYIQTKEHLKDYVVPWFTVEHFEKGGRTHKIKKTKFVFSKICFLQ